MKKWNIRFHVGDDCCDGETKRLSACALAPSFSQLGLDQLLASVKHASKIRYDLPNLVRLLVCGWILESASKWATGYKGKCHEFPVYSSSPDNVYGARGHLQSAFLGYCCWVIAV